MILHAGIDGGLHDVFASTIAAHLAWAVLGFNAAIYWMRRALQSIRSRKGGK